MPYNKLPNPAANIKSNGKKRWYQGIYNIKNVEKYIGDPTKCVYRSKWELHFMIWCDMNPLVKRWSSEFITIPYKDRKGNNHRYYPDFYIEIESKEHKDKYDIYVLELKPFNETQYPEEPKRKTLNALKNYEYQLKTFEKNLYKWEKAREWCEKHGYKFLIATEHFLKKYNII